LILWADGGLRTKELIFHLSKKALEHKYLSIRMNYYAPYHGKIGYIF
jgi:hypothetical protein